ncbi:MAG: hypothetical protein K8L99_12950 [Anaerolineae bacterium]|nr:hypothetical protein [Anaerolineae bacterium]
MKQRDVYLKQFLDAYSDLFAVAERYPADLTEKPGACGDWSARQVLAHCSGWISEALRRYTQFETGDSNHTFRDSDAFDQRSLKEREGLSWSATLGELRGLVDVFRFRVARLKPVVLMSDSRYLEWISELTKVCHEHTAQLEAFLAEESK